MRKGILILLLLIAGTLWARPDRVACTATGEGTTATAVKIWKTALATIYNIFPIKIGGVTVSTFQGLEDVSTLADSPVCVCSDPFPRLGLKVSLWEPIALVETTSIPGCIPSFGFHLPVSLYPMGFGSQGVDPDYSHNTYQLHYWKFPVFAVLGMFLDFVCLEGGDPDLAYMSEVDPLWQNDVWNAILNPEALLVANPIAQMSCMVDSAAANLGFPLDFMWWCLGSWGSLYPLTKSSAQGTNLTSQMAITARGLARLHRLGILWGSVGEAGLCGSYPMPIMRKSQYSILPIHPVPTARRVPIGRSELVEWGYGKEVPGVNRHVYVNVIYRKRDCCAF